MQQDNQQLMPLDKIFSICIPIVLCCDNNYAPYTAVTIKSIIDNNISNDNLDFVIFTSNVTLQYKNMISSLSNDRISIRFYELNAMNDAYIHGHFSKVNYYRFFISEIMSKYDKVIYLDVDMIVKGNIKELYSIDLCGKSIGVCRAIGLIYHYYDQIPKKINNRGLAHYWDEILKLKRPENYFNSGMLLIDISSFKSKNILTKLLKTNNEIVNPSGVDQDIFNVVFNDDVYFIHKKWNHTKNNPMFIENKNNFLKNEYVKELLESESDCKIIHYADKIKPWNKASYLYEIWWEYAKKTEFYEILLYNFIWENKDNKAEMLKSNILIKDKSDLKVIKKYDEKQREINVFYMCDKKSVDRCLVSMYSILRHKDEMDYIKYHFIIDENFTSEDIECLYILNTVSSELIIHKVNSADFLTYKQTTKRKEMPLNAYYRLHIPWLDLNIDKAIYLDYDTVVLQSLWELCSLNLNDYYLAAVDDAWKYRRYREMAHIQPESRHYNTGMLVFNCIKWREENIREKLYEFSKNLNGVFVLADQFLTNAVINKNVKYLDLVWNAQYAREKWNNYLEFDDLNEINNAILNPRIIHYTFGKPWLICECYNYYSYLWWRCARELPNYNDILSWSVLRSIETTPYIRKREKEIASEKQQIVVENIKPIGAVEKIKNQLSYRIGSTLVKNSKNPLKWFILPFKLREDIRLFKEYKIKNKNTLPLEDYGDYKDALKIKKHLSYIVGDIVIKSCKKGFVGILSLPYNLTNEIIKFKKGKK